MRYGPSVSSNDAVRATPQGARLAVGNQPLVTTLLETRKAITQGWLDVADALGAQGEASLAGEVRHFARHLPSVLTDKERVAAALIQHLTNTRLTGPYEIARDKGDEFTR
jgi:hypothetical protein